MASEHDRELVTRITAGDVRGVLGADDPAAVLAAVCAVDGTVAVDGEDLAGAIAAARVHLAEVVVARAHRAEDEALTALTPSTAAVAVGDGPAVRAAEAHLRRQQAAWKLVWWECEEPVPDLASWSPRLPATSPITLVSVDAAGRLDAEAYAEVMATAPVAIRLVVLQARG